jgi:hypothetical protein
MFSIKKYLNINYIAPALVGIVLVPGYWSYLQDQERALPTPVVKVDSTKHTNNVISGLSGMDDSLINSFPRKTIVIKSEEKPVYHYTLNVISRAEDEYWEIEQIDGNFYRVRREDYEGGSIHYEFDSEELIGNIDDLYRYVKRNNIRGTQIYGY